MGAIALSCLLSGGIGLIAGRNYSVTGLLIVSNLLFIAICVACFAAGTDLLAAAGLAMLVVLSFNVAIVTGLGIRMMVRQSKAERAAGRLSS
jgi:hypothetical protein